MRTLRGKVAVITGAAGGLGSALAERLAREGCRLALVDQRAEPLSAMARDGVTTHPMDVADARAWEALAADVQRIHGGADLLVNNAGVTIHGRFVDQSLDDIDRIVGVNLEGAMYGCRAFLPQLFARPEAHVVNVSSLAGRVAFPHQSTYCATKFALRGFGAALRMEVASRGVGVTTVLPGTIATRLLETAQSYDQAASSKLAALMLKHGARPERVSARVVRAIRRDEAEVVVGWDAMIANAAHALSPTAVHGLLGLALRARGE